MSVWLCTWILDLGKGTKIVRKNRVTFTGISSLSIFFYYLFLFTNLHLDYSITYFPVVWQLFEPIGDSSRSYWITLSSVKRNSVVRIIWFFVLKVLCCCLVALHCNSRTYLLLLYHFLQIILFLFSFSSHGSILM